MDSLYDTDKLWYLDDCLHPYCKACLAKIINTEFLKTDGNIKCKLCNGRITELDVQVKIKLYK